MKKQLSLIMAGGLLALASCNSGTNPENGPSQATIDSTVNARVEQIRAEMEAKNDSIINALAQWKADSMIAAMKGEKHTAPKPTAKAHAGHPVSHAAENAASGPANANSMEPAKRGLQSKSDQSKMNDNSSVEKGGLKSHSDQNKMNDNSSVEKGGLKSHADKK
jgi:hypothetical protein